MSDDPDGYALSYREAARVLGYSTRTVERLVAAGQLAKTGLPSAPRILAADAHAWLRRHRLPTKAELQRANAPKRPDPVGLRVDPERIREVWGD
jgi:excisionase family DNA binding protein